MFLIVSGIRKSYGPDVILENLSFRMDAREKVALVGRNGAGKTTLLKLLTGAEAPDEGAIQFARGVKVGYLSQISPVDHGRTVLEEAKTALEEQLKARGRLDELERVMESGSPSPDDLEEYARLHEHFLDAEGYRAENDLRQVLLRMGFTEDEFDRPTAKLSGGEKTRLALARLLLEEPDLLILDEPTNHLDLQATEWLESWIRRYHGAVLLVSHDRTFLQNTADRVLEMRGGTVEAYPGPFDKYLRLKAEREARQAEVARRQEMEIAKMDEYVRRFMNSQRTAQARGRLKLMNRLIANKVEAPKGDKGMKGGFQTSKRSGDLALVTEKLSVGFPPGEGEDEGATLVKNLDWTVRQGERWGVIGENGAGKSTLVKTALGLIDPLAGRARLGANIELGVFTQDASDLNLEDSPLDHMVYEMDLKPNEARNLLGRFLITGEDVYRPMKTLSGGERNKLVLASLTVLNPNLLILDEPTNHLDMDSREALAQILKEYTGTLILVSHDRHLLSETTDHVLDVRRSGPVRFEGGFSEYRRDAATPPVSVQVAKAVVAEATTEPTLSPRELSKEIGRVTKRVSEIEATISATETEIAALESRLANLTPQDDVRALSVRHSDAQKELEDHLTDWETTSLRLEELKSMQG